MDYLKKKTHSCMTGAGFMSSGFVLLFVLPGTHGDLPSAKKTACVVESRCIDPFR